MRVRITEAAEAELSEIVDYIALDSPTRAISFAAELVERCEQLDIHPDRYPVVAVSKGREIRRAPFGSYLIFYSRAKSGLEVNHIVHSARDYLRVLFPED